jgi:predicted metal-binding membrane protein
MKRCWPLMLVMFVFGLMNIFAMAASTLLMISERSALRSGRVTKISGAAFLVAGMAMTLL